ncbi:MAG: hypothetical protein AABO41_17510 [Acidobacteriota bacterium]
MNQSVLAQIEETFNRLKVSEQLSLIERLVHQVRQNSLKQTNDLDAQLALMAADPEIQDEMERIEQEFAYAE